MRRFLYLTGLGFLLLFVLGGCARHKSTIVLLEDPRGPGGKIVVSSGKNQKTNEVVIDEPGRMVTVTDAGKISGSTGMDAETIHKKFGAAISAKPIPPETHLLFFVINSTRLNPESEKKLGKIFQSIIRRKSTFVSIIGHTDRTGKAEYNKTLSLERARTVFKHLVVLGANPDIFKIDYHGENNPVVRTADGVPEPKNRRVEITVR